MLTNKGKTALTDEWPVLLYGVGDSLGKDVVRGLLNGLVLWLGHRMQRRYVNGMNEAFSRRSSKRYLSPT